MSGPPWSRVLLLSFVLSAVSLAAACGDDGKHEPTPTGGPAAGSERAVAAARTALAQWLGPVGDPTAMTLKSVEAVTWPDGCLELARPGQGCTLALVEGFRVRLGLGNATYEVRTDQSGSVARWAPGREALVRFNDAGPNVFEFTTDDGRPLVAQAVPGTQFGVPARDLRRGDPVWIAVADAPQGGGLLLVWLDRP